jgi:hypothetical protein
MVIRALKTASEVIDACGGTAIVQRKTRRKHMTAVSNWRGENRLPPDTFVVLNAELVAQNLSAPLSLWGMQEPATARKVKR